MREKLTKQAATGTAQILGERRGGGGVYIFGF